MDTESQYAREATQLFPRQSSVIAKQQFQHVNIISKISEDSCHTLKHEMKTSSNPRYKLKIKLVVDWNREPFALPSEFFVVRSLGVTSILEVKPEWKQEKLFSDTQHMYGIVTVVFSSPRSHFLSEWSTVILHSLRRASVTWNIFVDMARQPWSADVVVSTTQQGHNCQLFHHILPHLLTLQELSCAQGQCVNDNEYRRIPIQKRAIHNNIYLAIERAIKQVTPSLP